MSGVFEISHVQKKFYKVCLSWVKPSLMPIDFKLFLFHHIFHQNFTKNTISHKYLNSKGGILERISITEQIVDGNCGEEKKGRNVTSRWIVQGLSGRWAKPSLMPIKSKPEEELTFYFINFSENFTKTTISHKYAYSKSLTWKYNQGRNFLNLKLYYWTLLNCTFKQGIHPP